MNEDAASSSPAGPGLAQVPEDSELLRRYAEDGSEQAFAELVRRRIGLVYSVALRQTHGDRHRAEDATQAVFSDLARKARALAQRPVLAGWLYRSAQFAAAGLVRAEQRRQSREQEAQTMEKILAADCPPPDWDKVRPVLDHVLSELDERDRDAILLRYFDGRPFAEIGARLRLTENAARMRVERALDKLNAALARRGITSTAAAAGAALAHQAAVAAPAGLTATVTGAALAGTAGSAGGVFGAFMTMTKLQIGFTGAIVAAGATGLVLQTQTNASLRSEIAALQVPAADLAALRAQNQQLASLAAEVEQLRRDDIDFKQLAESVAAAQQAQAHAARLARQQQTEQNAQAEIDRMNREGSKLVEEYKILVARSMDQGLSAEARAQATADAKLKMAAIQVKQREIQAFIASVRASSPDFKVPGASLSTVPASGNQPPPSEQELRRRYAQPAPAGVISLNLPRVDYVTAFSAYEVYSGLKIIHDPSLGTIRGSLDLRLDKVSREEALEALRHALRDQLNIVLERVPDGKLIARRGPAR